MQKLLLGFTLRIGYFLRFSKCLYCYMYLLLPYKPQATNVIHFCHSKNEYPIPINTRGACGSNW